eukprot:4249274-Alexandrium_andersonii.AAC.1
MPGQLKALDQAVRARAGVAPSGAALSQAGASAPASALGRAPPMAPATQSSEAEATTASQA